MGITKEQRRAIDETGRVIVSAAAGSGKTFVMMQKLIGAIENRVDLDSVLAVTFTKKAAAQMKEKLRKSIIERIKELSDEIIKGNAVDENRAKCELLKAQLPKIQTADISTIHSFCARILRTYFYAIDIDGTFDIMASDDAQAMDYKRRVADAMFDAYYEGDDENSQNFKTLLSFYRRSRRDEHLRELIFSGYEELRKSVDYERLLDRAETLYTEEGFEEICAELSTLADAKYSRLISDIEEFAESFRSSRPEYNKIFEEMIEACKNSIGRDIFSPQFEFFITKKPTLRKDKDSDEDRQADEEFKKFREKAKSRYEAIHGDISDRQTEKERFFASGIPAKAYAAILKDFEREYTALKRDENKLDYNDLEHYTLRLLKNGDIANEVRAKYSCVFVDEYQDVNQVQEEIISSIGGENVFLVGDIKQAIYGFRGSESKHFRNKFEAFKSGNGKALKLPNNFRSSDAVLDFVNRIFSDIMTEESCRINYREDGWMEPGGGYPQNYGLAKIHIFGRDEDEGEELGVYSVKSVEGEVPHSREARAVLKIVEEELRGKHFDVGSGKMVQTQPGDICILTRKHNRAAEEIVRILNDSGYSVAGAQGEDITSRPEIRKIVDILSYIDNKQQDIPLATALLSPLGGLSCEELALIRIAFKSEKRASFRDCCKWYIKFNNDSIARKLRLFRERIENLRDLAEVFTASEMIDKILEDTNLEAEYSRGEKLKNIRRLGQEGEKISVSALLAKLRSGYEIKAPASSSSDSIKLMTMHASKGLEFPVVILSDICATFKGMEYNEIPLSKNFGFAPKCFDTENMLTYETVLRKLIKESTSKEELENELNLFYVACTRAKCNLHILAEEKVEFNPAQVAEANTYAKLFDMTYLTEEMDLDDGNEESGKSVSGNGEKLENMSDKELYKRINSRFGREYVAANSVNLPVKSSASAILKMGEEDAVCVKQLFGGEGETGTERGIAYHRFLELCNFGIKDKQGIEGEIESFLNSGLISEEQRSLLDSETLTEILNIPIFGELGGAKLYREQEFLCRLPANEIMDTTAPDKVLIQGAIDLLAKTDTGYKIIDYKYSHKSAEQLIQTYSKQLALYKKAVQVITRTDAERIETVIVNIFRKEQINL